MLFTLSPAKTLDFDTPSTVAKPTTPRFVTQSTQLIDLLKTQTPADISALMDLSDALAALNVSRYQRWRPRFTDKNSKPAVLAFMGDVYEGLAAASLSAEDLDYAQQHVRILSGLYGVLRPLDRMQPYRLEMGTPLANSAGKNLYAFWGDTLTDSLNLELKKQAVPVLVNLASEEYFKSVKRAKIKARVVDCVFEDSKNGQHKVISFYAKRARGLMARFAITQRIDQVEGLKAFDLEGYRFEATVSDENRLVFRRETPPLPAKGKSAQ